MTKQKLNLTDRIRGLYPYRIYRVKKRLRNCYKRDDLTLTELTIIGAIVSSNYPGNIEGYLDYLARKDMRTWRDKLLLRKPIYRDI